MEHQVLSRRLDTLIARLLEQKRRELNAGRKKIRVLITGNNFSTLPVTLLSLSALDRSGYQLLVSFSYSARVSGLKTACISAMNSSGTGSQYIEDESIEVDDDYHCLFLPVLSTNSLSKIALCIRDNLASNWVFHALNRHKKVIATLNPECLDGAPTGSARPLLNRLAKYVSTIEQYGVVIAGKNMPGNMTCNLGNTGKPLSFTKNLVTLSDILTLSGTKNLQIDSHTLITPAAQDEIRRQNITVIQGS
ncbi:hypothetical protein [Buttiauxella sp.]|uniref:hypothetical protein n=1 Tax=Buttiauxella sp. TaxID=1972222 RepID=UPI003C721A94